MTEIVSVGEQIGDESPTLGALFTDSGEGLTWTGEMPNLAQRFALGDIDLHALLNNGRG